MSWTQTTKSIAGLKLHVSRGGSGAPVLVLHHDIGTPDSLPFYDLLAQRCDVVIPHHPGWGKSERPAWMRHPRDIAAIYGWLLADLGLTGVSLVGLGFGGWVAAEMASQAPAAYRKLVLVSPMGIKPPEGDIADQAIVSYIDYPRSGFHAEAAFRKVYGDVSTDQLEAWDIAREMSFRTAWKPYMYSPTLPHLLGGVRAPALILWGDDNRIVPFSAAAAWHAALPGSEVKTLQSCGHFAEMEQPDQAARLAADFILSN
ncbi:MAG TPA: alpha/beta hydrolase [Rhodopila sp.]|uniref:alpha/beta fold hydrolase n=1 Tax=Rhodopila sp. TaxID=2480087 RepID=UPI002C7B76D4|nr:alpha/beta hydrolase [Rhodopila sp.]HVY14513.1 alpha/beta hydrolase [Rhodopila sp.]